MMRRVQDVMTRDVEVVKPEASLKEAAEKMRTLDVGPLPVCDGDRLVGIITDRDIVVRAVAQGMNPNSSRVADAMTADVEYVFEDDELEMAAKKMRDEQIRRLLVLDRKSRRLVGILALGDLAQRLDDTQSGKTLEAISEPSAPH